MDRLIVRVAAAVVPVPGRGDGDAPSVPSGPVEIGTKGAHPDHPEIGSWQALILMLTGMIVIGALVLLFVVRQRSKVLRRRRLRRMAEVARLAASYEIAADIEARAAAPPPPPHTSATLHHRARPSRPQRVT